MRDKWWTFLLFFLLLLLPLFTSSSFSTSFFGFRPLRSRHPPVHSSIYPPPSATWMSIHFVRTSNLPDDVWRWSLVRVREISALVYVKRFSYHCILCCTTDTTDTTDRLHICVQMFHFKWYVCRFKCQCTINICFRHSCASSFSVVSLFVLCCVMSMLTCIFRGQNGNYEYVEFYSHRTQKRKLRMKSLQHIKEAKSTRWRHGRAIH